MQYNLNIPIPILLFFMTAVLALVAYFIKDVHSDIKRVIENLTKAVHGLELITNNMEMKGNHIKERVEDLESKIEVGILSRQIFDKEYGYTLDWIKSHINELENITRKNKH